MDSNPPGRPGRPRDPETERALLAAALHVLEQKGYQGFTIEAVARRAGSSKVTIYRRWPSAAALLLAALVRHSEATIPTGTSGRMDKDLQRFFRLAFAQLNGRRGLLLRTLMAEAQLNEAFRDSFREQFIRARRASLGAILTAARDRGELARQTDIDVLLDLLFGAMWYRLLIAHAPLDEAFVASLTDLAKRYR